MSSMRTGADYRESLRDGRRVFVLGEGLVEDVTTHPATQAMVEEYVAWYDRHFEPEWQDTLLRRRTRRRALAGRLHGAAHPEDLARMGRCFSATTFLSAGNITHTPAYGHLIALGVQTRGQPAQCLARADRQCRGLSRADRPHRPLPHLLRRRRDHRLSPARGSGRRAALRIVKETDKGLVIHGKIGMHTSPAYAHDVYIGAHRRGPQRTSRQLHRRRSTRPASPWSAASPRREMTTRSPPRSAAVSTSSTARCGSTTC